MHLIRRLLLEFWLPGLAAITWTMFNLYTAKSPWDFTTIINIFGPSFFLASWATGQFFRVRKQVAIDKNLTSIETRVETLVAKLEKHTQDFIGYATGADSVASFMPMITDIDIVELGLSNMSSYPVFDVQAALIDLDEPIDTKQGKLWTRHPFFLPSLYPNRVVMGAYRFDLSGRNRLHLNIFIQTRSQGSIQMFRIAKLNGVIHIATKTMTGEKVEQTIPTEYPGYDSNNPDAIFQ